MLFNQNLITNQLRETPLLSITVVPSVTSSMISPLLQGSALQKTKLNTRFNDKQK